jgi:hypothetical protein
MPSCNLRVTVRIDIEAEDFLAAAEHQKRLEENMAPLLDAYPSASVSVSRWRGAAQEGGEPALRSTHVSSGKVKQYG